MHSAPVATVRVPCQHSFGQPERGITPKLGTIFPFPGASDRANAGNVFLVAGCSPSFSLSGAFDTELRIAGPNPLGVVRFVKNKLRPTSPRQLSCDQC
jgi:hypothetical protein